MGYFGFGTLKKLIKRSNNYLFLSPKFSIVLPKAWQEYKDEKDQLKNILFEFYKTTNPVGGLQISAYEVPKRGTAESFVRNSIYEDFKKRDVEITSIQKEGYDIAFCTFIAKGTYWNYRQIYLDNMSAVLTYNCEEKDINDKDLEEVDKIFDSFKFVK